jgi:uncharacterized protein (DUF433 family)
MAVLTEKKATRKPIEIVPLEDIELVPSDHPLFPHVWANPKRMGGQVCFRDTRVPVTHLFDHLAVEVPVEEFLDHFPPITLVQVAAVLDHVRDRFNDFILNDKLSREG